MVYKYSPEKTNEWSLISKWWFPSSESPFTPQKFNIDTKKWPKLKGTTFSKPSFWVSMLVFGGVTGVCFRCVFVFRGWNFGVTIWNFRIRWAQKPVTSRGLITPNTGFKTPVTHLFSVIYRGYNLLTPFISCILKPLSLRSRQWRHLFHPFVLLHGNVQDHAPSTLTCRCDAGRCFARLLISLSQLTLKKKVWTLFSLLNM